MKITQYCSVCKEALAMDLVPTEDGEEDGVIWLRCPRCQGFLPKISDGALSSSSDTDGESDGSDVAVETAASPGGIGDATESETADQAEIDSPDKPPAGEPAEPLAEYAALLATKDLSQAVPYRPWQSYAVGDTIHNLAWDECGVVVAKEKIPGNRNVVKVYFEKAGLVRLIEQATGQL